MNLQYEAEREACAKPPSRNMHYMVDISKKTEQIFKLVEGKKYFPINCGCQLRVSVFSVSYSSYSNIQ